ncbi:inositol phosphorylceramide synthase [Leekyejoonella antrihumi]|uniref:Inositol phosphorylceramide synthase n=1 Tax=Leekyejoonella antrihumi TaxID=1660198 RepID=A0A563E963_9MICO|nr:inositol phosphorylceramide synthase [Leekyejoonella antrihumi]
MAASGRESIAARVDWKIVRRVAIACYLVVLIGYVVAVGVPLDRVGLTLWILVGLSTLVVGKGWRAWWRLMLDWLPFQGILLAYDYGYGMASHFHGSHLSGYPEQGATNGLGLPLHVTFPVEFDKFLFGGHLPNQWIQEHFHATTTVPWISVIVTLCYCSHFVVTPLAATYWWIVARDKFRIWVKLVVAMAIAGLATYFLYPMSPPWLASMQGSIPGADVARLSGQGWQRMGFHIANQVLGDGQARSNPVAAMPSLHMAYAVLIVGFVWCWTRRWWLRIVLVIYPLVMAFSLVYAGEHYVTDEIFGVLYAVIILGVWQGLRRRSARREVADGEALLGPADGAVDITQSGGRQPDPALTKRDAGVQPDPLGVRIAEQVD